MGQDSIKKIHMCLKFIQKMTCVSLFSLVAMATEEVDLFKAFNPTYRIKTRTPQSFIVDTDYFLAPAPSNTSILAEVFVEDDAGVLRSMRENYDRLIERDEYVSNWNLGSTGLYKYSTQEDRVNYFNRHILKYLDKRVSGEVKKAEEGSTMASIGAVQNALKPNTNVAVSENIKIKFKAQVLQGYADINVINPYVHYSTSVNLAGEVRMNFKKEFKETRSVASVEYNVSEENYVAQVDQELTQKWSARISSTQTDNYGIFTESSNSKFQLIYSTPFNY